MGINRNKRQITDSKGLLNERLKISNTLASNVLKNNKNVKSNVLKGQNLNNRRYHRWFKKTTKAAPLGVEATLSLQKVASINFNTTLLY